MPRALIALTVIAAALASPTLGSQSLWLDEALTGQLARGDLRRAAAPRRRAGGEPAALLLLRVGVDARGGDERRLRAPSAVFGIVLVPVAYAIGRRLGGRRAAGALAALVAVHPLLVYYSQEARGYAAVALACAVGFGLLPRRPRGEASAGLGARLRGRARLPLLRDSSRSRSRRRSCSRDAAGPCCPRSAASHWPARHFCRSRRAARRQSHRQRDGGVGLASASRAWRRAGWSASGAPPVEGSGSRGSWARSAVTGGQCPHVVGAGADRGRGGAQAVAGGGGGGADRARGAHRRGLPQQPQHAPGARDRARGARARVRAGRRVGAALGAATPAWPCRRHHRGAHRSRARARGLARHRAAPLARHAGRRRRAALRRRRPCASTRPALQPAPTPAWRRPSSPSPSATRARPPRSRRA